MSKLLSPLKEAKDAVGVKAQPPVVLLQAPTPTIPIMTFPPRAERPFFTFRYFFNSLLFYRVPAATAGGAWPDRGGAWPGGSRLQRAPAPLPGPASAGGRAAAARARAGWRRRHHAEPAGCPLLRDQHQVSAEVLERRQQQ